MKLTDLIAKDNAHILSLGDISEDIEISTHSGNRRVVKGSFQSDLVNFSANAGLKSPLCAYAAKLYIESDPDMSIGIGGMLTINGVAYKVDDKREEMGVLELSVSRSGRW